MSSPSASVPPFEFSTEQNTTMRSLGASIQIAAFLCFAFAAVCFVAMILRFMDAGLGTALFYLILAAFSKVTGLILLTTAGDAQYLGETKGYLNQHLGHLLDGLIRFCKTILILGSFLVFVFGIQVLVQLFGGGT